MIKLQPTRYDAGPLPVINGFAILSDEPDDLQFCTHRATVFNHGALTDKWVVCDGTTYPFYILNVKIQEFEYKGNPRRLGFNSPEEAFEAYMKVRDEIARKAPLGYWTKKTGEWEKHKWQL